MYELDIINWAIDNMQKQIQIEEDKRILREINFVLCTISHQTINILLGKECNLKFHL